MTIFNQDNIQNLNGTLGNWELQLMSSEVLIKHVKQISIYKSSGFANNLCTNI